MIWRISTKELRDISVLYQERGNSIKRRKQSLLRLAEENPPSNF
jgi:hypothetical protein